MRITFVSLGWEQLGVSLLSAIAKERGHTVNLAFSVSLFNDRSHMTYPSLASWFDDTSLVLKQIEKQRPDVLAFSALSGTYQWMLGLAEEAKRMFPEVKVVFGGVHTTAVPDNVLAQECIDYICVGEGDISFPMILKRIERGMSTEPIPNTRYKLSDGRIIRGPQTGFIQDLDSLPMFDKTLWEEYMQFKDSYITMASRGCPYRCTFCFNSFYANLPDQKSGKYIRYRSVDHMMSELVWAKKRYGFRLLEFFDDVFTLDKKWMKSFLSRYKNEINVPYQIFTHIKFIDDETVKCLAASGCRSAQIGVQSLDEGYKKKMLNRFETVEQIEKALKIMKKYKVLAKFDHMLGLPGESIESQEKARMFYAENPPYRIQTYWVNFYPGTEMQRQALDIGIISSEDVNKLNDGLTFDSFTHSNEIIDSKKVKMYEKYQLIFKLIPNFPKFIRKRLTPKLFKFFPVMLCSLFTFIVEVLFGLLRWDPDHRVYAKFYLFHMYRLFIIKLGFKPPSGTVPLVNGDKLALQEPKENEPLTV